MLYFISFPLSGDDQRDMRWLAEITARVTDAGHTFVTRSSRVTAGQGVDILKTAEALLLVGNWQTDLRCRIEEAVARLLNIPVKTDADLFL